MKLKELIKNSEERLKSFKLLLEEIYKNKNIYPVDDDFIIWFKSHLHDMKNIEQNWLTDLIEEKTYENSGLNSPFCYK